MNAFLRLITAIGLAAAVWAAPQRAEAQASRLRLAEPELRSPRMAPRLSLVEQPQELDVSRLLETFLPRDEGGGAGRAISGEMKPVIGLLLGVFIGFGLGHLVVGDRNGFVLWLIIDLVVIVAATVLSAFLPHPVGFLTWIGFLAERIIQGVDAYDSGGGGKLVERSLDSTIFGREALSGTTRFQPVPRSLSWAFDL